MKTGNCSKCGAQTTQGSIALNVMYCCRSAIDEKFCDGVNRLEYED